MGIELLYPGIENQTHCFYSSLYLSIFLSCYAKHVSVSVFLETLQARIFKHGIYMQNIQLYSGIETQTRCSYAAIFLSIFHKLTMEICVRVFSESVATRNLKLGIHKNNEYCRTENQIHWYDCPKIHGPKANWSLR